MIQLIQPLHHAYGVSGNATAALSEILLALRRAMGFNPKGNPDFRLEEYEVLGIDEARALKEAAERTAVTAGKKVFIVSARGITKEAQNALLKIFEEPPGETHFFLIVPSFDTLLPTLRSRLCAIQYFTEGNANDWSRGEKFLRDSVPVRLKTVQAMLKALEKEKDDKEDSTEILVEKERIIQLLSSLECALASDTQNNAGALSELLKVKKYARDRAPSFKLLLEHLALVLPQMK